jgi:hypothetical protein
MTVNSLNYMSLYTLATNNTRSTQRFKVEEVQEVNATATQAERKSSDQYAGFIDTSYNRDIGIPDNIHLSEKIVSNIEKYLNATDTGIDVDEVIRRSWDLFQKWTGQEVLEDQDGFISQEQYEKGITGVVYLDRGTVKTDNVLSGERMEHDGPGFYAHINASAEVDDEGLDIVKNGFKDFSGGVSYPDDNRKDEIAIGTVFNNFLENMTAPFDPQSLAAPGKLQSVLAAHGGDWLRNIPKDAQGFLQLLTADELMGLVNKYKLDVMV